MYRYIYIHVYIYLNIYVYVYIPNRKLKCIEKTLRQHSSKSKGHGGHSAFLSPFLISLSGQMLPISPVSWLFSSRSIVTSISRPKLVGIWPHSIAMAPNQREIAEEDRQIPLESLNIRTLAPTQSLMLTISFGALG